MSGLDFLFQGNPPPSTTSTTSSTTSMPDWYQDYMRGLMGRANAIAAEPYMPYGGARIAGFTPDQQAGFGMTRGNVDAWRPGMAAAFSSTAAGAAPWNESERARYLSPYLSGVVGEIGRLGNENLVENVMPRVENEFSGAGQFGSSRHMDFMNRAMRDSQREILGQQSLAMQRGYEAAGKEYGEWGDRALAGGRQFGELAGRAQQMGMTDAAAMEAIGAQQQNLDQRGLDLAHQDFLEQRGWPRSTTDWMSSVVRGFSPPTSATQTSTAPFQGYMGPSPLAQLTSLYGLGRGAGLYRRGGRVRRGGGLPWAR